MRRVLAACAAAFAIALPSAVALVADAAPSPGSAAGAAAHYFGVNMSLYDANDSLVNDARTQALLSEWGVPLIRVPLRPELDDATYLKAMRAVAAVGAKPMIIIRGPQPDSLTENRRILPLVREVFGEGTVYLEYGNEEDLEGMGAAEYTRYWNQVVPELKTLVPASYKFVGPVNFEYNPGYAAQFVRDAEPKPDYLSWHEYVCNAGNDDTYCTSHIGNWARHVSEIDDAVRAATGRTFPFFISEWNLNPQDENRYGDSGFVQPWTRQALDQLRGMGSRLAGAMIYTATDHGDFGLIDGVRITPQGAAFRDAALASRGVQATPSPTGSPFASPTPSGTAAPSGSARPSATTSGPRPGSTARATDDPGEPAPRTPPRRADPPRPPSTSGAPRAQGGRTVRLSFESGTDGFDDYWGSLSVDRTTATHYDGRYALSLTSSAPGYAAAGTTRDVSSLRAGKRVTFHVWFGGRGAGTVQPWVMDTADRVHETAGERGLSGSGWMTITWTVPSVTVQAVGLELHSTAGGATEVRLDALSWPG
ncbi:hypothetical protein ABGB07_34175 [Micromonosporaceae bacterium B7E4]